MEEVAGAFARVVGIDHRTGGHVLRWVDEVVRSGIRVAVVVMGITVAIRVRASAGSIAAGSVTATATAVFTRLIIAVRTVGTELAIPTGSGIEVGGGAVEVIVDRVVTRQAWIGAVKLPTASRVVEPDWIHSLWRIGWDHSIRGRGSARERIRRLLSDRTLAAEDTRRGTSNGATA